MKQFIFTFLTIELFCFVACPAAAYEFVTTYDFEENGFYFNFNEGVDGSSVSITHNSYSGGYESNIVIPPKVIYNGHTYDVTGIGESAFSSCISLQSVTIPMSITTIGDFAFSGCEQLSNIIIPNSVISIGLCAFQGCYGLNSLKMSNSVTTIGDYAFYDCSSFSTIEIPNSVISLGQGAFKDCI